MTENQRMTGMGEQPEDWGNEGGSPPQTLIDRVKQEMREEMRMAAQGTPSARANRRLEDTADEFLKLERNQDTNLGCIRTEIEELMGAETTGYREALKDVKKYQEKAALYPALDGRTWRTYWETVDRDLALFPLPDLRGLIIWSTLPRHLQQACRGSGFINRSLLV